MNTMENLNILVNIMSRDYMQIFNDLNKKMALVDYTGFVGSNLMLSYDFEYCYN